MNPKEQIEATAQEIADIVYQKKFNAGAELLSMRFEIGEALIASPLWKKATRGQLLAQIEVKCGLGERSLRYCAEFKQKYNTWENVMSYAEGGKLPVWRDIVKNLPSGSEEKKVEEESETRCSHKCSIHE